MCPKRPEQQKLRRDAKGGHGHGARGAGRGPGHGARCARTGNAAHAACDAACHLEVGDEHEELEVSPDVVVHREAQRAHVRARCGVVARELQLVHELAQPELLAHGEAVPLLRGGREGGARDEFRHAPERKP